MSANDIDIFEEIIVHLIENEPNFVLNGSFIQNCIVKKSGNKPMGKPNDIDLNYTNVSHTPEDIREALAKGISLMSPNCKIITVVRQSKNKISRFEIQNFKNSTNKIKIDIKQTICSIEKYNMRGTIIRGISEEECIIKKISALTNANIQNIRIKDIIALYEIIHYTALYINNILKCKKMYGYEFEDLDRLIKYEQEFKKEILSDPKLRKIVETLKTPNPEYDFYYNVIRFLKLIKDPKFRHHIWVPSKGFAMTIDRIEAQQEKGLLRYIDLKELTGRNNITTKYKSSKYDIEFT